MMQFFWRVWLLGICLFGGTLCWSQDTLLLSQNHPRLFVPENYLSVLVDSTSTLEWASISSQTENWLPYSDSLAQTFPLQASVWGRLDYRLAETDTSTWVLQLGTPDLAWVYQLENGSWKQHRTGVRLAQGEKSVRAGYQQAVKLKLSGPGAKTLYLKLQELEKTRLSWNLVFKEWQTFQLDYAGFKMDILFGNLIIISILSIMMLYHLMLFLTTRERAYLYYALYVLAVDLVIISDGIFLPFVQMPGGHFVWSQLTYIFFGLISVFYYLFSRAFLHTREILPKWDRAMVFLILFKMLVLVLGEVMRLWLEDPWFTDQARYLIFGLDIPFLLVFFIPLYRSGIRSGRYFMVATAIIFLFGFAVVLFGRMLGINPFVPFVLAFILHILVFSLGLGDRLRREQEEKLAAQEALNRELKKINEATSRFVPYQFLRSLGKESVLDVQLGDGVQKEMSVFFADIRSYTTLSEKMSPRENFEFLNQYLGQVGPIIQTHGGFVNQYYGDGIMALFQEPPLDALMAAIQIQRSLQQFNLQREQTGKEPIRIGIGMHTGPLLMGVIGDQNRMDAGVVSDTVNTAARMEGLTKHFGASILLSEKTMAPIPPDRRPPHRYLGKVQVKGRRTVLSIYECFAGEKDKQRQLKGETLVLFEEALQAYEQRKFQQASQTWETILRKNPLDVAAHRYFRMSKQYQDQPPPADWQAIQNMQAK